jgi:hypothetical protein
VLRRVVPAGGGCFGEAGWGMCFFMGFIAASPRNDGATIGVLGLEGCLRRGFLL